MATSEQGWCREDGKGREIARIKGRPNVCVDIVKILGAARFSTRGDPFKPVNENKRRCRSSPAASSAPLFESYGGISQRGKVKMESKKFYVTSLLIR